jgi:aldoxime dehydratase
MESAVPLHLQCPRTRERKVGDDYAPPFPAWTARTPQPRQSVVMALLGVQASGEDAGRAACAGLKQILDLLQTEDGPVHYDLTHYVDECRYVNMIAIAYWPGQAAYDKSFGLGYWHALADLERWAESHPTHVAIFGKFMQVVQALNFQLQLRLYHEVAVLASRRSTLPLRMEKASTVQTVRRLATN